jgi:hypothetical protein
MTCMSWMTIWLWRESKNLGLLQWSVDYRCHCKDTSFAHSVHWVYWKGIAKKCNKSRHKALLWIVRRICADKDKTPKQSTLDSFSSLNHIHSHLLSHVPLLADDNPAPCEVIKQFFPPLHSCSFININLTTELSHRWLSNKPWQILWCVYCCQLSN